ncbi:MAG: hypothetical protein JXR56_06515, partial [Candidatus Cloacimonetes bacterium]|nr:hypothetical protein [Candidatus Cloacimonadota bacterium]
MKKAMILIALSLLLCELIADGTQPLGTGTENNPFQIATLDNLLWLSTTPDVWDDNAYFVQTA